MVTAEIVAIDCELSGDRPLMFDRYPGDNNTKLAVEDKLYLDEKQRLILPVENVFSLLTAENSKSVCKMFFGKNGKLIASGIKAFVQIEPHNIPILDENDKQIQFTGFSNTGKIYVDKRVARLKETPNPKERPVVRLPWKICMHISYRHNKYCPLETLRSVFEEGGILGLGTFRPFYGTYALTGWTVTEA